MIPVSEPLLGESELENVRECIRSGWISSNGSFIERFEDDWAAECERTYGVAVSNGTVALQLAVAALRIPPGSEIIMPSFTIMSCALAALYNDCVPVLVDADPATWCMAPDIVEEKVTSKTKVIMPVHIYGHPVDMDPIEDIAASCGAAVIEDAAEAHGAQYLSGRATKSASWRTCGSFGDVSTFSFYANKLVTTGEGGMLLTDDEELAERARSLRNLAFAPPRRFVHGELGFNFRLTNLQAALGVAQIERFDAIVRQKRRTGAAYTDALSSIDQIDLPSEREWARSVYWMYGIVIKDEVELEAEELGNRLRRLGIDTRPFFYGLHAQPVLRERGLFQEEAYPVTDRLSRKGLYLPSGLSLSESDIERVVASVKEALRYE